MALIKEKGVLTYKSNVETVTSKAGNTWPKQTVVVSREGVNAPFDKIALQVFGDKVNDSEGCKVGDKVEITYSISAREYNGKWFNDISLFKMEKESAAPAPARQAISNVPASTFDPAEYDDLPL